jgi:uncharacterized peroxidase-related enzyme
MYLKDIESAPGSGGHAAAISRLRSAGLQVPQILHMFAFKSQRTDHLMRFTQNVMRGPSPLSPGERELIAAFTSERNRCRFCHGSHAAVAAELLSSRQLVEAAISDFSSAPIPPKLKALLAFVQMVALESSQITQADVDAAKAAGWSDEALYDAITVCALFNFYNRWVNASGVADMPTASYEISGKRMANEGYVRE